MTPEQIAAAALLCQGIERTGREVGRQREKRQRQAGGSDRGAKLASEAAEFWAPSQEMFRPAPG